jgi:hypothetical protein
MTYQRELILESRLKQKFGAWRRSIQRLKLRLKFERAESVFLAAAADLLAKCGLPL